MAFGQDAGSAGGAAMKKQPPAIQMALQEALKWLDTNTKQKYPTNYKASYLPRLKQIQKAAGSNVEKFNKLFATLQKHIELKENILDNFEGAAQRAQLAKLSLVWKSWGKNLKSPAKGEKLYETSATNIQKAIDKKSMTPVAEGTAGAAIIAAEPVVKDDGALEKQGEQLEALQHEQDQMVEPKTSAAEAGLQLYAYKTEGQDGATLEIRQAAGEGEFKVLGTIRVSEAGFKRLLELSQLDPASVTINKVGSNYELLAPGRRETIDRTQMAVLLAATGHTLSDLDGAAPEQKQVEMLQTAAQRTCGIANEAPMTQSALKPAKKKEKKNFFQKIIEWLKLIISALAMYTGLMRLFELLGVKKATKDSREMESESRAMLYTITSLDRFYDSFERNLEDVKDK